MLFFTCEFIYGAMLASLGSSSEKTRGYRLIRQSVEVLVQGLALVFISGLLSGYILSNILGRDDIPTLLLYSIRGYENATEKLVDYIVSIGWVAAQLYMSPITSPLGHVWMAQSWLATYSAHALLAMLSGYKILASILANYGVELLSAGLALTATTRLKGMGGVLASSVLVLSYYLILAEHYIVHEIEEVRLDGLMNIPVAGPAIEIIRGSSMIVIKHGEFFVSRIVLLSFTLSLALIVASGFSLAIGGLARALSARL